MNKKIPKPSYQKLFVSLMLFTFVFVGLVPKATKADLPVINFAQDARQSTEFIWQKLKNNASEIAAVAFRNGMNTFLSKLAYDTATWIATGDSGQRALIFTSDTGFYANDLADAAFGATIEGFANGLGFDAARLCNPSDINFQIKLGLSLETLYGPISPYDPVCTASQYLNNWKEFAQDPDFENSISLQWDPSANPLGQAISSITFAADEYNRAREDADLERVVNNSGFKNVTETVSGAVLTPGRVVEQQFNLSQEASLKNIDYWAGAPLANALSIFSNTLISKYSQRIQEGLVRDTGTGLDSLIAGSSGGTTSGVSAAEAIYSSLSTPNFVTTGSYDVLTDLINCEDEENSTSEQCVINSTFQVAVENKWTVRELVDYMVETEGKEEFKFADDQVGRSVDEVITYRGILVLKKYRIVPVGWQLAAEFIQGRGEAGEAYSATLKQIVDCYDTCGNEEDIGECQKLLDGTNYSPFCRLVDPTWVLKAPENYCQREAPGSYIAYEEPYDHDSLDDTQQVRAVSRLNYCADNRACIQEEKEDVCTAYGYCFKEKRIYRADGEVCEHDSCQTFTDEDDNEVSYLKNTLNYNDCATDPGCKWYCLATDAGGSFICKDQDTVYDICDSTDPTYYTDESCTCEMQESCWVEAGSGGSDPDTYSTCELGHCQDGSGNYVAGYNRESDCTSASYTWFTTGETCDLGDNCGASNVNYNSTYSECLCTDTNTCEIEIDTDDGIGPEDASTCEYTYEDDSTATCALENSGKCNADYENYTYSGYCSASEVGDFCALEEGQSSCVNDVGNTCEFYKCFDGSGNATSDNYTSCDSSGGYSWEATSCTSSLYHTDLGNYCKCDLTEMYYSPSSDSLCNVAEGYYSCTSEDGYSNKAILGTKEEDNPELNIALEAPELVYDASINLDNNLAECESEDASCSEMIRILEDTNLLYNPSFETIDEDDTPDDDVQDYFGFYEKTGTRCLEDSIEEGACIGWQQHGNVVAESISDSEESGYSLSSDYGSALLMYSNSATTIDDNITSTFDTGYPLANRSFTFSFRAVAPYNEDTAPRFMISTTDYSVTVPGGLTDEDKANYDYFDESGSITNYSSDYTDYYYTVNFPANVTDSAIKVTIFATDEPIAIDIAKLSEATEWDYNYSLYGENNTAYLQKDYLECDTEDVGCELYTPTDQEDATSIPGQITNPYSAACDYGNDFSLPDCNQCDGTGDNAASYYVGCDFYQEMPLETVTPIDYYLADFSGTSADPEEVEGVAERTGYYCAESNISCFDESDTGGICADAGITACQNNISLIPSTATECSAAEVGCEEYTNLDTISSGGEGLEYYSYIKQCVKPDDTETYTYHTWEGSDSEGYAMVLYTLKTSNLDGAPCTHLDPEVEDYNASCVDSTTSGDAYELEDCTAEYGTDPDCVKFYDDDLNIYYRYKSQTVSVSEDCVPLRSSLDQRNYYSIPTESTTCSESVAGCREYQGAIGSDIEQIINETFVENSTEDWLGALTTSNESLFTDDYSLRIDSGSSDDETVGYATTPSNIYHELYSTNTDSASGEITYSSDVEAGATYIITFWAKGDGTANLYLSGACDSDGSLNEADCVTASGTWLGLNNNYYFTESGFETDGTLTDADINLNSTTNEEWEYHMLGPVYLPASEDVDAAVLRISYEGNADDAEGYIDNIILEKSNSLYLIKNSFDTCFDYEGCRSYEDRDRNDHYLKSFKRLCEYSEVGCEMMIDTLNSSDTEFTETFLTSNEYDSDDIIVPYDQARPLIYDESYECAASAKGCTALGLPDINEQTDLINSIETTYQILDPDNLETLMCEAPQLQCKEYTSADGTEYFKDPGDRTCEYKSYTASEGTSYGWFKKDTDSSEPDCPLLYSYDSNSQPRGSVCNSNSKEKAGQVCNNDADCMPESWASDWPQYRCISKIEDDIDQWDGDTTKENHFDDDGYELDPYMDFAWVGTCSSDESGCTKYIDPNSPNITELLTNGGFENNIRNNVTEDYFDDEESNTDDLPDYWEPITAIDTNNISSSTSNWNSTDGSDENYSQDGDIYKEGTNSLFIDGDVSLVNTEKIYIERDETYTLETYVKLNEEAFYDGSDEDIYYRKFRIGGLFMEYDEDDETLEYIDGLDPKIVYFTAYDPDTSSTTGNYFTFNSSDYEEDENHPGYSQWIRLAGTIGVNSDFEIPEGANRIKIFIETISEGTTPSATGEEGYVWFDETSFKQNDEYLLIDYTVDGTSEREDFDGVHSCIDPDTEEEAITSDGGCVAFKDTASTTQDYVQFGSDSCSACSVSPNSDSCRYTANACDTNTVLQVTRDRVCDEWIACRSSVVDYDNDGNKSYVCLDLEPCTEMNEEGVCDEWGGKPSTDELGESDVLNYYTHSSDADDLYNIENLTGYVKVGLTWQDYQMCESGSYQGSVCSSNTDCESIGSCQIAENETEGTCSQDSRYTCVTEGDCNLDAEDGICGSGFSVDGYYPYGWMYERGGGSEDEDSIDLIAFNDFENLHCQGKKIDASNACILNSYDSELADEDSYGHCWESSFVALISDDDANNNPSEGNPEYNSEECSSSDVYSPCFDNPETADYYCPNNPSFGDFPFKTTDEGWSDYGLDSDNDTNIKVTQYDSNFDPDYPENLAIDTNNVLQITPTDSYQGVKYGLEDKVAQNNAYSLSFKARYTTAPATLSESSPSLISIGFKHNDIVEEDSTAETENYDWFVESSYGGAEVVFLLDISGSMDDEIKAVKAAMPDLITALEAQNLNVKFSLVTMDEDGNNIVRDLTTDSESFIDTFGTYDSETGDETGIVTTSGRIDPADAVIDVMDNDLDNGSLSFSDAAKKYIVLITDTVDEKTEETEVNNVGLDSAKDNGIDIENAEELASSSEMKIIAIVNENGYADYYADLASESNGYVLEYLQEEDWSEVMYYIQETIIEDVDLLQFTTELETYTFGPITISEKEPGEGEDYPSSGSISTDLIFVTNDLTPFQIDDVSVKPILEVSPDEYIGSACRAYAESDDKTCNFVETNGTKHEGWMGYCLEANPENEDYCITWWPLDSISGETNLNVKTDGGYDDRLGVYHCLVAKGYEDVGFCTEAYGIMCESSGNATSSDAPYSDNCPGAGNCHQGSNYVIDDENSFTSYYNENFTIDDGHCAVDEDIIDEPYDCSAYPTEVNGICTISSVVDEDIVSEEECTDESGTWTAADPWDLFDYDNHVGEEGESSADVDGSDFTGYGDPEVSAICESYDPDDYNDTSGIEKDKYCFYYIDDEEETINPDLEHYIRSNKTCNDGADCDDEVTNADYAFVEGATYECVPMGCSAAPGILCENDDQCQSDNVSIDWTGEYLARPARWQMHDPYDANSGDYETGIISYLPANAIGENIHFSEIEQIDLYLGNAGVGSGGVDESRFWGQGDGNVFSDGKIQLTNLLDGGIPVDDETGDKEPWQNCRPYKDSDAISTIGGVGCWWWGQYDSEGDLDELADPEDSAHPYDLVYVWGLSAFTKGENGYDGTKCTFKTDDSKLEYRFGSMQSRDPETDDEASVLLESSCVEDNINYIMNWDNDGGAISGNESNPWEHLEGVIENLTGDEPVVEDFYLSDLEDDWEGFAVHDGSHSGGAIFSIYLDFDDTGYLDSVKTLIYNSFDDLEDGIKGIELTRDAMMYAEYHLRETCVLVAETVSVEGETKAWAKRAAGDSSPNTFDIFSYGDEFVPWGSIGTPTETASSISENWDPIDSNDENNIYKATSYGQEPVYFWDPSTEEEVDNPSHAGTPFTCLGKCSAKYCVGYDDSHMEGTACGEDEECESGICMGVGQETISGLGYNVDYSGYSSTDVDYIDQLEEVATIAQNSLQHVFADIVDSDKIYEVNHIGQWTEEEYSGNHFYDADAYEFLNGIYQSQPSYWDSTVFENMELCEADGRTGEIGTDEEYCGVRPSISDIALDTYTNSNYSISNGQTINLTFNSTVDPEQENIKYIYIDWGDGSDPYFEPWNAAGGDHTFTNAYTCDTEDMQPPSRAVGNTCEIMGRVVVVDNWGWCSGDVAGSCTDTEGNIYTLTEDHCDSIDGASWTADPDAYRSLEDVETLEDKLISGCGSYDEFPVTIIIEE